MAELHPRAPWQDITFCGGYWNCEKRLDKLLKTVRPWFANIVVAVQESPDGTLAVAQKYADVVLEDRWYGRGDPSIHKAVGRVATRYAFVVSDDEMPSHDLLYSMQDLVTAMVNEGKNGAWIHFRSKIDGFDFTREQDNHLRLFERQISWPSSQHARPMTDKTLFWKTGHIDHNRSLDEMMRDYVRRYELGEHEGATPGQQEHNRHMMRSATHAIADRKGWHYIRGFPWYEKVVEIAYEGTDPAPPVEEKPKRRRKVAA